jgi:hypothetical protein
MCIHSVDTTKGAHMSKGQDRKKEVKKPKKVTV